ncbi:MAG: 30S ribosome-binding factor RbfA [Actinomycetota bacterium]|nr:30S ribosome-binding factor RbfA [Actinomycetota bacterium]
MPSKRGYQRLERVNEALREVVADELRLIDDEQLELVTITGVKTNSDLRHAVVWFSCLSSGKASDDVSEALVVHRVRLQASIARQLRLKRTPELAFQSDPAIAVGTRVEEILKDMKRPPQEGEDRT